MNKTQNAALEAISELKRQKIAEAIINIQDEIRLPEIRESIFQGISNLAPNLPEIYEQMDQEAVSNFFHTLRKVNDLIKEIIEIMEV